MVDLNLTISIITLNVSGKTEKEKTIFSGIESKTQFYASYRKSTINIMTQTD